MRLTKTAEDANTVLCLDVALSPGKSGGNVMIKPCSGAGTQIWSQSGRTLRHPSTGLCAALGAKGFYAGGIFFERVVLAPCDTSLPNQSWYAGDPNKGKTVWEAGDNAATVVSKCSPAVVLGNYQMTDPGAGRIVGRYGSTNAFLAFVRQAIQHDCSQMFLSGKDVPVIDRITVNFWPASAGTITAPAWATHDDRRGGSINLYNPFWATSTGDPYQIYAQSVDAVSHHELAHLYDAGVDAGVPGGIIEGYANLIVYRTGYITAAQKVKGGNWQDGYSTTAFFLDWLDNAYAPMPLGSRFTDIMQVQFRSQVTANTNDGNWFLPWAKNQTGKTIDRLWTAYQATF